MELTTLNQVIQLLEPSSPSYSNCFFKGFSIDTRTLKPQEIFVALKGERVDGHDFLSEAKAKGASAAIVSKQYQGLQGDLPLIFVEDPLHALQELAKKVLAQRHVRVVAVTGSIGKTTTKEFIKNFLSAKFRVAASPGNSNSQVGVPLTILNHTIGDEEILVLEMGMTTQGHIARLVHIAPPEVALITSVALVHACNFETLADIGWAKAEIFSHPQTRLGILHRDIVNYAELLRVGSCRKLSFSLNDPEADYSLDFKNLNAIHAKLEGLKMEISPTKVPGKHNLHNLLAAITIARHFNVGWEEIKELISHLTLPERRLQFIQQHNILFLNDSYNASELSVKAALELLPNPEGQGRKIAVLGSMMELGKFSHECHQRVGEFALNYVDQMYCLGEECQPIYQIWKKEGKPIELFLERSQLVEALRKILKPSDVVLLKGSRSKELWKVLEEL